MGGFDPPGLVRAPARGQLFSAADCPRLRPAFFFCAVVPPSQWPHRRIRGFTAASCQLVTAYGVSDRHAHDDLV